jgi:hypothetical protein
MTECTWPACGLDLNAADFCRKECLDDKWPSRWAKGIADLEFEDRLNRAALPTSQRGDE